MQTRLRREAVVLCLLWLFAATPAVAQSTVSLSATPNPVSEGNYVTVTATLSSALAGDTVVIRVTSTNGTAEDEDYNKITLIRIAGGETTGSRRIFTLDDADTDNETFTVALREDQPSGVTVGTPSSVTVTISDDDDTPRQSSNANLSGLTASSATNSGGTYTSLALTPSTFSAGTTSYTATVANARTHAKVTPTVEDTGKATVTVDGTPVTSGSASGAIALNEGANAITVRVTAQDGTTQDYTVTITRQARVSNVPTGLSVTAGDTELTASWTAPSGVDVSRYEVQIKLKSAANWPTGDTDVTGTSNTFTGLTNDLPYLVRVRTVETGEGVAGDWTAPAEGTPQAAPAIPTVSLSASPNQVAEGSSVTVTATLSSALSGNVNIPVTVTDETAESGDHGTLTSITINSGATSGTGTITTNQDTDYDDETFTVALGTLPSEVKAGTPSSVEVTIRDDDKPVRLSMDAIPACGATVTDASVRPSFAYLLTPAPAERVYAEYRVVTETASWPWVSGASLPIEPNNGRSIRFSFGTFAELRQAHAGFRGFEYRLRDTPDVTAQCTWRFDDDGGGGGGGGTAPTPTVSLSVSPNPVDEGEAVTVTARLSSALSSAVTIPLAVTAGTAESGDFGSLSSIAIAGGSTTGAGRITTSRDADADDETFTVALGSLPSSVAAGSPRSVTVRIRDDDGGGSVGGGDGGGGTSPTPVVSLSASPNPVDEGEAVTVTARLSSALSSAVTIPLAVTSGTAESGDYGSLSSIAIDSGSTTGTGRITTSWDADSDDETFTVGLGSLPSSVRAGSPRAVEVTIRDGDPRNRAPTVSASCDPCGVGPGGEVRLAATASDPDGDPLTYAWSAPTGRFTGPADEAAARWRAPARIGRVTVSVRVSDGRGGTAAATVSVEVTNAPPAFGEPSYTFELRENEDGRVRPVPLGVALAEDPDGDEVTYSLASGAADLFAVGARDGAVTYVGPGEDYETEPNRYELTVRARDPHGSEALAPVVVEVMNVNEPPVAAADTAATAEDAEVEIDVLANDTDAEGDALRVLSVTAPSHGIARIAAGGGVIYAPETDWHGTDRFVYKVTDGNGGTATAGVSVVVEPVNDAPEPVADTARTAEDEEILIDVLANDSDVEGDALRVESVTEPGHGAARVAADGGVVYAPEADWHGTDRFTYTVADGDGATAEAEVVVRVAAVNDAPVAVGEIPDQALDEGGGPAALDLAPYFKDPDGDPLTYTAVSSDPDVASAAVAGSALTLTPVGYGPASIEVTARDPGGLSASQTFAVNASDRMVRAVLDETLAAMARAHLASARMTLGRRVASGGADDRSRLTVGGSSIPLDGAGVREAAGRLLEGWAVAAALGARGRGELRSDGGLAEGGIEWMFAFGEQEGSAGPGGAWRLWGQGDIQTFAGDPSWERGYEGDLRTGWAGIDRALGERWLLGLAVARSGGGGDWRAGSAGGRLTTSLTALQPYLRWSGGATSLWAMAGGGWGSAQNSRGPRAAWGPAPPLRNPRVGTSDLGLRFGLLEARSRFTDWLWLRADAAWARLATGSGDETVDGRGAAVNQQRLGIELRPSTRLAGLAIEPIGELSARRDGGAGQTGSGVEVTGGLRAAKGPVRIDARGRLLVLHSAGGYAERGLGVTLSVGSPAAEDGFSVSISPRWGGPATASGTLWEQRLGGLGPPDRAMDGPWSLDARSRYALRLPGGRLLAWSGGFSRSDRGWSVTLGGGIEPARPAQPDRPPR